MTNTFPRISGKIAKPKDALAELNRWAAGRIAIREMGLITDRTGADIPLVHIAERADIRRRIELQQRGEYGVQIYSWRFFLHADAPSFGALKMTYFRPHACTVSLLFDIRKHYGFLKQVALTNTIGLTLDKSYVLQMHDTEIGTPVSDAIQALLFAEAVKVGER